MTPGAQLARLFWRQSRRQFVPITAEDAAIRLNTSAKHAEAELKMLKISKLVKVLYLDDTAIYSINSNGMIAARNHLGSIQC